MAVGETVSVAVISANFGGYACPKAHHMPQRVETTFRHFVDYDIPSRERTLLPRMAAKVPKMFGWELLPGHDAYIWLDAPFRLSSTESVAWWLEQLGDHDVAVFQHPTRHSIHKEASDLRINVRKQDAYSVDKYFGEDLAGIVSLIEADADFIDNHLYAAGAFCYRPTRATKQAMRDWWWYVSRYHVNDQLSLPFAIRHCSVQVIRENIYHASHLVFGGA